MILAIDVGNSNIVIGGYEGKKAEFVARISSDTVKTWEEYAMVLNNVLYLYRAEPKRVTGAILSSVVPPITPSIRRAVKEICGVDTLVVGPGIKTGLNIKIDNPAQLGTDLVAVSVAALAKYPMPCIVVDLGTATKISVLDQNGVFIGCSIMPGVMIGLEALSGRTAQLPHIGLDSTPSSVIGTNTIDSMTSGVILGTASMLDGMAERIREELKSPITVVATGGLSASIVPFCKQNPIYDQNLLLDGLRLLFEKNNA